MLVEVGARAGAHAVAMAALGPVPCIIAEYSLAVASATATPVALAGDGDGDGGTKSHRWYALQCKTCFVRSAMKFIIVSEKHENMDESLEP